MITHATSHKAQFVINRARERHIANMRRMGESTLAKTRGSRRKDVNSGIEWVDTCASQRPTRPHPLAPTAAEGARQR